MPKATPKKKAAPKAKAKAAPKKKSTHSAHAVPKAKHENFMMKLLKQKEEMLKKAEADGHPDKAAQEHGFHSHARGPAFSKFAGHRRRNAS